MILFGGLAGKMGFETCKVVIIDERRPRGGSREDFWPYEFMFSCRI